MRGTFVCAVVVGALGCGSVKSDPGVMIDAPEVCTIHNTIDSCGPSCAKCTAASDRETATCDGVACGATCKNAAPKCSDSSCSRLAWTFDSNMLDGITPRAPNGLALAVRNHAGNVALATDVQHLSEISFRVPVCLSGTLPLQTRTLTASIFLEGGTATGDQYYIQTSVPSPMTGAYLTTKAIPSGSNITYSAPISMSQFAMTATDITFQVGSLGADFSGTIWIDDIKVQ